MSGIGDTHVEFGMYPFASVAWAWDDMWAAVQVRAPWLPATLHRSGDVHARWDDPDCLVTHVCGWPFAAFHCEEMHLVGAFSLDISEARNEAAGFYRSVLLSPHSVDLDTLVTPTTRAVANSADSLSGWLSLLAATVGAGRPWVGSIEFTSAHYDSLQALSRGDADLACIDSWTLALIEAEEPELLAELHRIGRGPCIPTPAITARATMRAAQVTELRGAFQDAVSDASTAPARAALHISGLVDHDMDVYLSTLALTADRPLTTESLLSGG